MPELIYKHESYLIQGTSFDIYKQFRNRHKEIVYQNSFYLGLKNKGLRVDKEKRINVYYNNKKIGVYTPDLVVENKIIIEWKVKNRLTQDDLKQFWYYLKSSDYKLGYLINFGAQNGVQITRRVN